MASKFQFITELYSRTLTKLTGDYESWTGFLRSACYNYKCPFDEQVLIYAQRPNATAVLELEKWNRQFGRWVNAGATGIAVIDEARGKGRLKHYFDITDTHATRISRPVPIWSMEPAYTEPVIETLEATFGTLAKKDNLPDAILSASRNAVADNMQDYLRDLLDCRGGSMLEELDALNVEVTYRRALESSVAYMLLTRLSLPAAAYILPEDFEDIYSFDTPTTINALGIATSDIAEMGLREISRTVMQARREQFFAKDAQIDYDVGKGQNSGETERSVEHGSDLQSARGLSPAEPAAAPRGGGASGQVRRAAEAVHQEASQGAVYKSQDQRSVGGTSGGDRDGGGEDGDAAGGADGAERGRDGGAESRRSPALDGADEQPEAQRGGNGAERPDLQLISEEPARAGSDVLPALADNRANLYQYDTDGRRVAVLNKKETAIAQGKQELLKEAFSEWIWKDPERREKICKAYNILFNSNRPREYDGSHINFSGMNPEITLRKHQVNAIAHILYGGNTLLAHVVGAGKTFEMVAAAMESKRLGLCQKSLFVVPNHLTEQWASEFLQLYPAANVLVATKKDFETKNRKRFCGRIATGDYDAVIIGHSQFEKIPVSIQRQRAILEQQMDEIILGIQEAKNAHAENFTIKQMEKTRKGLQNKLDKLNDQSRKDDVVTFEELGVDRLFIDESHYYDFVIRVAESEFYLQRANA